MRRRIEQSSDCGLRDRNSGRNEIRESFHGFTYKLYADLSSLLASRIGTSWRLHLLGVGRFEHHIEGAAFSQHTK